MVTVKLIETDQDWTKEITVYWFELTGEDKTGWTFDNDQYGFVDGNTYDLSRWLNADGYPLPHGDLETIAVQNNIDVTDELRQEVSGL